MNAPHDIAATRVPVTLADSEKDNTSCNTRVFTWDEFAAQVHDRRDEKFARGILPARFRAGACTCGDAPRSGAGALKGKRGCPDHPANYTGAPRGHNLGVNLEVVTLVGIDLDQNPDGTPITFENAARAIMRLRASGVALVIWSSHSYGFVPHQGASPKCNLRVFVLPSREIFPHEYKRIYGPMLDMLGVPSGIGRSPSPRRFWLLPSARPGAPVVHEIIAGRPLDVDALLAIAPPLPVREYAGLMSRPMSADMPSDNAQQLAIDALAAAWPSVGSRHETRGELAGALAWSGWDEDDIVRFLDGIAAATNGGVVTSEVHASNCRWAASSVNKISTDDAVSGWPTLAARLGRQEFIDAAKRALGIWVPMTEEQERKFDCEWNEWMQEDAAAFNELGHRLETASAKDATRIEQAGLAGGAAYVVHAPVAKARRSHLVEQFKALTGTLLELVTELTDGDH